MARDAELIQKRDKEIVAEYTRLRKQEYPVKIGKNKMLIRLTYSQVLGALMQSFHLSVRTLEAIVAKANEVHPHELNTQRANKI